MKALVVALCLVAAQAAPPADEIELVTGEVLKGHVVERTERLVVFDHPVLGRLDIPAGQVRAVRPIAPPPTEPEPAAPGSPATLTLTDQQKALLEPIVVAPAEERRVKWKGRLDVGLTAKAGVTEEVNARLGFNTSWLLEGRFFYRWENSYYGSRESGTTTDNKFNSAFLAEWPWPGRRWGIFGQGVFDYDQFQSWRERLQLGGGVSYVLIDVDRVMEAGKALSEGTTLIGRVGANAVKEWGSQGNPLTPEAILGVELAWQLTGRQRFAGRATLFPNLEQEGDFRFTASAEWIYDLDAFKGLDLVVGLNYEYQSIVDPGVDRNDLKLYASLGIDF